MSSTSDSRYCCAPAGGCCSAAAPSPTHRQDTVDDTIQPISAEYIDRAIEQARQTNADAVLIEINTPGGLVDSTRDIIQKILASPVPVIVYVTPDGRARCFGRVLHSGIGGRCRHGAGYQYRSGASGGPRRRKDGRHHEDEDGERFRGLHALVRRAARPQRASWPRARCANRSRGPTRKLCNST